MSIRVWLSGAGLAILIALVCIIPLFLGRHAINQEEAPSYFSTLYGLLPFFPGQNRILALLPLMASPARTIQASIWLQYAYVVLIWSVGLAAFMTQYAPRVLGLALPAFLGLSALTLLSYYDLLFSPVNPYLTALGLALLGVSTVGSRALGAGPLFIRLLLVALGCILVILATGINPISGLLAGGYLFAFVFGSMFASGSLSRGQWKRARSTVVAAWPQLAVGLVAAVSVVAWTTLQFKFAQVYPQSVMSNYSVESYSNLAINLSEIFKSYVYFIDGIYSRSPFPWLKPLIHITVLGALPFGAVVLWLSIWKARLTEEAIAGASLYVTALFASLVTTQNSHVLLIDSAMRSRYFVGCFIVFLLSFAILICVVLALLLPARGFRRAAQGGLALFAVVAVAGPTYAWATATRSFRDVLATSPDMINAANAIRSRGAIAVVGDYWVVWPLHPFINIGEGHQPSAIPVTVRTEAFPLRTFRLWERALIERDSILVACVRQPHNKYLDGTPPGDCEAKMNFNIVRGSFPAGRVVFKDKETFGVLDISYYELSRAADGGSTACAPGDIVFRGTVPGKRESGLATYSLSDGGFLFAGMPADRNAQWQIEIKSAGSAGGQGVYQDLFLAPGTAKEFSLGHARYFVRADDCRVIINKDTGPLLSRHQTVVTVSRRPGASHVTN